MRKDFNLFTVCKVGLNKAILFCLNSRETFCAKKGNSNKLLNAISGANNCMKMGQKVKVKV